VRFDIILDHTADFADAIVGHGLGQRESGMSRKTRIVAETREGRPTGRSVFRVAYLGAARPVRPGSGHLTADH